MKHVLLLACIGLLTVSLQGCGGNDPSANGTHQTYAYKAWSDLLKSGTCSLNGSPLEIKIAPKEGSVAGIITCRLQDAVKSFRFPAGIFEIGEQLLIPGSTAIIGAECPNDMSSPMTTPDWSKQTLFLATRGATDYNMNYCHAHNMVTTRVGFVLSSYVAIHNVSYQGLDTIRPNDNGALCGGGAFETKGCAENDCSSNVNNGGSDGLGSVHVTIANVRLNDFYHAQDEGKLGASIDGNYDCKAQKFEKECCFCKPNGIRSSQVGVWVPMTRNAEGTHNLVVTNVVSRSTQADGVNLHGNVRDSFLQNLHFENTGDDVYAVWAASLTVENVTFQDCVARNPGILRPNWYGSCFATYGLKSVLLNNLTCKAPTLPHPIPSPSDNTTITIDKSMFVLYTSFGANYPLGNNLTIKGWTFQDLQGTTYVPAQGSMNTPEPGKMVWTKSDEDKGATVAPYYFPDLSEKQKVNVYAMSGATSTTTSVVDAVATRVIV